MGFCLFSSFVRIKITILHQINVNKLSIQYTILGFEPTTIRNWVSSHNHKTPPHKWLMLPMSKFEPGSSGIPLSDFERHFNYDLGFVGRFLISNNHFWTKFVRQVYLLRTYVICKIMFCQKAFVCFPGFVGGQCDQILE